ncbi:MAG: DEAD/DEAH box helicase [Rhodobacterales bacterium RIFCSPHIGHO2_02_FULL_62_130]|nr:MAG: DEAD/DEAH box helicase [Rhodobacterales bacterium RIFCSPHIGHO2_12_FULL_62_75]OHC59601.1 MAG: DEAD/DEAH box helicase [Rhodobacterales bacterium RIFCSPHIGHO2_02_FULL_62_130]
MIEKGISAPLAAALAAKGYETLTAVQEAVLKSETQGRDLLVSAQTGSGKTVAFGIAIADQILGGMDKLLYADTPLALVIAPTRELALQVARELEWLYAGAGAQIATCVGGMDYRSEKRALDRGAHIVVGTPGRLRDHIDRRSLDLSGLRAAVLDEADEMLDLGFREDLEYILAAAPEDRRTLMFSATVPKEIAKLAEDFQRDALRIAAQGEAKQHVDIQYRALSVAVRDREHAIFNALRFYEAKTAIVFCKTRVNVNHLMARMGNRGFKVVALSGELSQQERTNALTALRNGRANVCIATDVAARGIDLPGLELVIHADLPSNSETLLHRSGRTGRAGAKGVSALIVVPAEFKKAQRLLQGAKVVAEWGAAPSADDVQAKDDTRIFENPVFAQDLSDEMDMAMKLIERFGPEQIAAAYVRSWRSGRSAPEVLSDQVGPARDTAPPRERGEFGASVWYQLSVGRAGRAEARWLLPKICDAGGITKDGIGAIRVQEDTTFVQIAEGLAGKFGAQLELENGVVMERIQGEPSMDRPERAPRKAPAARAPRAEKSYDRAEKPTYERAEKPVYERAEKPAYVPKPPRVVEDDARPAYNPLGNAEAPAEAPKPRAVAERKPYTKREDGDRKPYAPRAEGYKSHSPREGGDRKPYAPRAEGAKPYAPRDGAKPYAKREDGDRKPYAPRAEGAKPYAKREDGDRKPYAPRAEGAKPYAKREDGDRKPYAPRAEGAKPYAKREDGDRKPFAPRSAGFKSHGGGADGKPARAAGFKSHASEGKTFAKPAAPKGDAKDTSKRFVPPKPKR